MDSEGHGAAPNPSAVLAALVSKRDKLQDELRMIERQIGVKRSRKFQPEDRLFSLSSITSPAVEEHVASRDDGRAEYGPGRSKGGRNPANGQGKQKKGGRVAVREGKRFRQSSEHELDDEDDLDRV